MQPRILVLGVFSGPGRKGKKYTSAAEQLADLLDKNRMPVIRSSRYPGRMLRLADTVITIVFLRHRFDVAILPLYGTRPSFVWQEIAARLLKFFHKKMVLVVHGGSIPQRMLQDARPFVQALTRADEVVCPSAYLQSVLARYQIVSGVVENVLPLTEYPYLKKKEIRPRLIWMRAFEEVYHPMMAVRVAAGMKKKYPSFAMVMAGTDLGLLEAVKKKVDEEGLQEHIVFPGYIDLEQKIRYARDYDIFISTNRVDNAPVTLVEFMALGVPVVSVRTGGIPFMIENGRNGLLVEEDDDQGMLERIEELISDPMLAERIRLGAYQYSRRFDEPGVFQKWMAVFDRLSGPEGLGAPSGSQR